MKANLGLIWTAAGQAPDQQKGKKHRRGAEEPTTQCLLSYHGFIRFPLRFQVVLHLVVNPLYLVALSSRQLVGALEQRARNGGIMSVSACAALREQSQIAQVQMHAQQDMKNEQW